MREYSGEISGSRISVGSICSILHKGLNVNQNFIPKMITPEHTETLMSLAGASAVFPGLVTAKLSLVSITKKCSERTVIRSAQEVAAKASRALTKVL
jgi:hypothetical protein